MSAPRTCALGLALALLASFPSTPARAQDAFERQVRAQLDAASGSLGRRGFALTHEVHVGRLDEGADETVTLDLGRGRSYMIVGVCDEDCSDLDLVLYDGDGDEVDSDLELDDFPIVSVPVDRADSYRVKVRMADCSAEPCRYGIGVYARASTADANGSAASGAEPDWRANPTYGTVTLAAGFEPDPYEREIQAGGDDEVELDAPNCSGFVHAAAPDLDLDYEAGSLELFIWAESDTDLTLVVNQPDGRWICSDDENGTDPMIRLQSPMSGNYNIWIGTYDPAGSPLPSSTLFISEIDPR